MRPCRSAFPGQPYVPKVQPHTRSSAYSQQIPSYRSVDLVPTVSLLSVPVQLGSRF
jgi:hypothetical protein